MDTDMDMDMGTEMDRDIDMDVDTDTDTATAQKGRLRAAPGGSGSATLLQTYKIIHGVDKVEHERLFQLTGPTLGRQTRFTANPLNIVVERANLDIRKNSYTIQAAEHWNRLDSDMKSSNSVLTLKGKLTQTKTTGRAVEGPRR